MTRYLVTLRSEADRERAAKILSVAPTGTRVEFRASKRSTPQNSRLWLMLTEISKLVWHGQRYSPDDWKDYFMHAYRGDKWMPFEEGGMVPIGRHTSQLSKVEFGELMTLIEAFCARQNIELPWDEPQTAHLK